MTAKKPKKYEPLLERALLPFICGMFLCIAGIFGDGVRPHPIWEPARTTDVMFFSGVVILVLTIGREVRK